MKLASKRDFFYKMGSKEEFFFYKVGWKGGGFFIKYTQRGSIFLEFEEFLIGTGIPQKNINMPLISEPKNGVRSR